MDQSPFLFLRYHIYSENTLITLYNPALRKSTWFSFTSFFWWSTLVSRSNLCYTVMDKHKSQQTTILFCRRKNEDCAGQITQLQHRINTLHINPFTHTKCWLHRQLLRNTKSCSHKNPVLYHLQMYYRLNESMLFLKTMYISLKGNKL